MKKLIIAIGAIFIIVLSAAYLFKYSAQDKVEITSANQAIAFIKEKHPELKSYPSDNLPPKRIEVKQAENGWQLGFYTEGSGLPGILSAKCYLVTNSGNITATGEFSAGGKAGPSNLDVATCKDGSIVSEEVGAYFTSSVITKAKSSIGDYEKLGLGGGIDGFTLLKLYPNLKPADFINVNGYQGNYSVENGKLTFTGNAASNSGVLMKEGMTVLLENISERLKVPVANNTDVDILISKMSVNEPLTARINQLVSSFGVYITPLEVIEDSRCPANANCIQAGTVKVKTALESSSGKSSQILELNKPITIGTKVVTLIQVDPQSQSSLKIKSADYVFHFEIKSLR